MSTEPRKTRRELAADTTREDLLQAGAELAFEAFSRGQANPLRLLSPSDIAERASARAAVSRAMLYHLWPAEQPNVKESDRRDPLDRLDPYRAALFKRLFEQQFDPQPLLELFASRFSRPQEEARVGLAATICTFANLQYARHRFHPEGAEDGEQSLRYRFGTLLAITGERLRREGRLTDEDLEELRSRQSYKQLAVTYQFALDRAGLRLLDQFEIEDLVEMMWAIQDGFTLNSWHFDRLNRTVSPSGGLLSEDWDEASEPWSLFAVTVWSVLRSITEPVDGGADASD